MIALATWPLWSAPLLNAMALALALGFRRNRAVLILLVLTVGACALAGVAFPQAGSRGAESVRMFAPWLLLAIAVLPERGLLARRNLVIVALVVLCAWLTIGASDRLWPQLAKALPAGFLPWHAGKVAAAITFVGAGVCMLRWLATGVLLEVGLFVVLALGGCALLPQLRAESASTCFALAGAVALLAVLYASYRMAFVDALSGLPNRRALDETLNRISGDYAVAMVDVDHFKHFNDTHGHAAGDTVLQAVAAALRRERRARAFRYGGEEFCLLFSGARSRDAVRMCDDTRRHIEQMRVRIRPESSRPRRGQAVRRSEAVDAKVTVSIGVALRDAETRLPALALKRADEALYRAKSRGRNRVVCK